jgi:hypothetical protein
MVKKRVKILKTTENISTSGRKATVKITFLIEIPMEDFKDMKALAKEQDYDDVEDFILDHVENAIECFFEDSLDGDGIEESYMMHQKSVSVERVK